MQFLMENYIWFLVAGIVGLMTVIGYIAEKTDFGRKEVKKEESKAKKAKKDVKKLEESKLKLNDVVYSENNKNIEVVDVNKVEETDAFAFNDLNVPETNEDLNAPLNNSREEDLTVPLNEPIIENSNINLVEEDLTVPLSGKLEDAKRKFDAPIEEDLTVPLNNETSKLDSVVEETNKEIKNVNSTDDIWKF